MIARPIWADVGRRAATIQAQTATLPSLAVIYGGEDPGAASYRRQIARAFGAAKLVVRDVALRDGTERECAELMTALAGDRSIHGILVQLPLPAQLSFEDLATHLPPDKDVEGLHPINAGRLAQGRPAVAPSTPLGGLEILRHAGMPLVGRTAVVVGRSSIVGRPMAELLLREHATVVVCHSRTLDLGVFTRQADVLMVAAGRPGLVSAAMVKPGAVVVDFGTNFVEDRLVGDVLFDEVRQVAAAITPVPGGTGPVTTAVLGRTLVELAERALLG